MSIDEIIDHIPKCQSDLNEAHKNLRRLYDLGRLIHPDADGTETVGPLPYEPKPVGIKRKIRKATLATTSMFSP